MELAGRTEVSVNASPARVWALLVEVTGWKAWMPGVRWAVLEGALQAGAYVTIKPERGRQTAYRIDAAVAPLLLTLGLTFGPVAALRRTWMIEPDGAGARVIHTVEIAGPLRGWLVARPAARLHVAAPALLDALRAAATG